MPFLILVLWIGSLAPASARELQPKTYVSPSGVWSLRVEPVTRDGTGEADYTLVGGGREAWRVRHPFALCDAVVTDDGRVAGYAYVEKPREMPFLRGSNLHVVVLSPKGEVLLNEAHERWGATGHHEEPVPHALGQFMQPALERYVVRVKDEDAESNGENWWAYDISTGKPLFQCRPIDVVELENAFVRACATRAVPSTPLVLVHWYRSDYGAEPETDGAFFQLLDAEHRSVWRLDLPHDYELPDEDAQYDLGRAMRREGAILAAGPRTFALRHVASGKRVSYEIAPEADGTWKVSEVGREPYEDAGLVEAAPTQPYRPQLRSEVALGAAAPPKGEIRDILDFAFDGESRLRFLRDEEGGASLVKLTEAGDLRSVTRVPDEVGLDRDADWFAISSPNWIATAWNYEDGERARAWRVNEETGAFEELADFPGQAVERVAELPGERLVVLSAWHSPYTITHTLSACDGTGKLLWSIGEEMQDPAKLFSPSDVAVTTDGKVVVLDGIRDSLQVFSESGEYVETIDLESILGPKASSFSIVADPDGGVLLRASWPTRVWRLQLDGSVRAKFTARMVGGEPRDEYNQSIQVAPDGNLWATDRHEFVRLDEDGMAFLQLGAPARVDWLEVPGQAAIDSTFGRILIEDRRTNAVHVFDGEGRRVLLCQPRDEDRDAGNNGLGCDSKGGVLAGELRFASDGTSLGVVDDEVWREEFVPGRDSYWAITEDGPARLGADGEIEFALSKLPDGRWWRSIESLAVTVDGRLAVLDAQGFGRGASLEEEAKVVALFDFDGEPLGQHELPIGIRPDSVAFAGHWVLLDRYGSEAWLLDTRDGRLLPVALGTAAEPKLSGCFGFDPSGAELWLLQPQNRRLLKFALPP